MKKHLLAGACAMLLAVPAVALAQSASGTTSPDTSATDTLSKSPTGDSAASGMSGSAGSAGSAEQQAAGSLSGAEMLGKKVKLKDGQTIGEVSDVLVTDGKPTEAVISMDKQKDKPVMVTITQLSPQGSDYILSLTEAQLAESPQFTGPKSGQTSMKDQQAQGKSGETGSSGQTR